MWLRCLCVEEPVDAKNWGWTGLLVFLFSFFLIYSLMLVWHTGFSFYAFMSSFGSGMYILENFFFAVYLNHWTGRPPLVEESKHQF